MHSAQNKRGVPRRTAGLDRRVLFAIQNQRDEVSLRERMTAPEQPGRVLENAGGVRPIAVLRLIGKNGG